MIWQFDDLIMKLNQRMISHNDQITKSSNYQITL